MMAAPAANSGIVGVRSGRHRDPLIAKLERLRTKLRGETDDIEITDEEINMLIAAVNCLIMAYEKGTVLRAWWRRARKFMQEEQP